jgi:hypothetical protein
VPGMSIGVVNLYGVQDPDDFLSRMGRAAERVASRGGTSRLAVVTA